MKLQHAHGEKFECESFGELDNEAIIDKINNIKGRRAEWDLKQKKMCEAIKVQWLWIFYLQLRY